jgi:hypothetical protein
MRVRRASLYPSSSSFVAAAKPHCPRGLDERFASGTRPPRSPATMRKAMLASVIESKKASASTQMLTWWKFVINARIRPKTKVRDPRFLHLSLPSVAKSVHGFPR